MPSHPIITKPPELNFTSAEEIRSHIAQLAYRERQLYGGEPADRYSSFADYIACHGQSFTPAPWPTGNLLMRQRQCYTNVEMLVRWSNGQYLYAEGYAGPDAIQHAWAVRVSDLKIIDPTWGDVPADFPYLGCIFPVSHSLDAEAVITASYRLHDKFRFGGGFTLGDINALAASRGRGDVARPLFGRWLTRDHLKARHARTHPSALKDTAAS